MNTFFDTFAGTFSTINTENIQYYLPLIAGSLIIMVFVIFILTRPKRQRSHTKQLHDLTEMVLRNKATIESFELMVGTLLKKVERFESELYDDQTRFNNLVDMCKTLGDETSERFQTVYKLMEKNQKTLITKQKTIKEDIKIIHDAIFVPDNEDDEDSDYNY